MAEIASAKLSIDVNLLPARRGARVLDVGCGDGRHVSAAAKRGAYAVGVDFDAGELKKARERFGSDRVDLIAADASHLPFREESFDAVICTETLEHLPDDVGAIREIADVLRVDGLLLGAVPSHFTERLYWRLSRGYWHTPGGHVRIYRPHALIARLERRGLRVEGMRYVHFIDSLFWLRFCLTDFLRPTRPRSDFEAAVSIAVAEQRETPSWRRNLRRAVPRSRFIGMVDAVGALFWPKSFTFVARKRSAIPDSFDMARADAVGAVARLL